MCIVLVVCGLGTQIILTLRSGVGSKTAPEGTLAEHHEKNHNLTGPFSRLRGIQGISDFDLMHFLAISAAKHVSRLGVLFGIQ